MRKLIDIMSILIYNIIKPMKGERKMKKKTTALAVASLLLAGAMCMSFASCGDGEETAESMTGEEVTKAQWEAAFGEENFKNVKIEICILEETDEGKTKNEQEIVVQDGKLILS